MSLGCRFSGSRAQQQAELIQGVHVKFTLSAHVAYPGREIGDSNQFVSQPREISQEGAVHLPGLAFITGNRIDSVIFRNVPPLPA